MEHYMSNSLDEIEEKEKLIVKYLSMSYSFDTASQLADEDLGLAKEETKEEIREKLIKKYLYGGSNLSTAEALANEALRYQEENGL